MDETLIPVFQARSATELRALTTTAESKTLVNRNVNEVLVHFMAPDGNLTLSKVLHVWFKYRAIALALGMSADHPLIEPVEAFVKTMWNSRKPYSAIKYVQSAGHQLNRAITQKRKQSFGSAAYNPDPEAPPAAPLRRVKPTLLHAGAESGPETPLQPGEEDTPPIYADEAWGEPRTGRKSRMGFK